ncbi:MAG: NEL-type E3 ubiquitin ligase domain-containing protein [Pseudomonas sp.]
MPSATIRPQTQYPANDFIVSLLPDWMTKADHRQVKALQASVVAHLHSQQLMAGLFKQIQPLDAFAKDRLGAAIQAKMDLTVDLETAVWQEQRLRVSTKPFNPIEGVLPPDFETQLLLQPLLQKLLQNFSPGEPFSDNTAVFKDSPIAGEAAQPMIARVDTLVTVCRESDVGSAYQSHLAKVLGQTFTDTLAKDLRLTLAMAVELAALQGQLASSDLQMLRLIGRAQPALHAQGWQVEARALQLLGCRVEGGMAFELHQPTRQQGDFPYGPPNRLKGVIVYLPQAGDFSLRRFADWDAANRALVQAMAGNAVKEALVQRIALSDRTGYLALLNQRLSDDQPDLQPAGVSIKGDVFSGLAQWHVQRIKADARFLAVPTADADSAATAKRLANIADAGLTLLGLAGLLVPVIGGLLLADMARQLLGHVFAGVNDWSQGHQHEALEHLLTVATSAALLGGTALGGHTARNAFVESLEPITTEQGTQRLWRNDLEPYRKAPAQLLMRERHDGLFSADGSLWWHDDGTFYAVRQDAKGNWRLLHREGAQVYGPPLHGNGERGWWLSFYRPLEWQGSAHLLTRLWPAARALDAERLAQILRVADVDEPMLRKLLVERRALPVALRDTLERFAVQEQNESFFAQTSEGEGFVARLQWCSQKLALQHEALEDQLTAAIDRADELRPSMLEHFAEQYLRDDPALPALARHFPTLPKAYALQLLKDASQAMRQTLIDHSRLPLALAQRARSLLQEVRLVRLREALYLRGSYCADLVSLVFNLLRKAGLAAGQVDLVWREGSSSGAVLERLQPAYDELAQQLDMVWKAGLRSELKVAEPHGVFEVLAAVLAPGFLQKMRWLGDDVPGQIRAQLQTWLPADRQGMLKLMGWREARPLGAVLQRLEDGRVGYPLGPLLSCLEQPELTLRRRIRSLYPSFNEEAVERYLGLLYQYTLSPYSALLNQEQEYDRLDERLNAWARHPQRFQREQRLQVTDEFRRAWRMEGVRLPDPGQFSWGSQLYVTSLPVGELPTLPVGTDYGHVLQLTLVNMRLSVLPPGFLACFPRLQTLRLDYNHLQALPAGLEQLTHLQELSLTGNRIRLTAAQAQVLANCSQLRFLDLSDNLIGSIGLRVGQLVNLESLNLRNTNLRALPEGLERCQRLTYVDLSNNQVADLPDGVLDTPVLRRQVLVLSGNPLSVEQLDRLRRVPPPTQAPAPGADDERSGKTRWLDTLPDDQRQAAGVRWDALRAEERGDAFFDLLDELTRSTDFVVVPQEIGRRVWGVISAACTNDRVRQDLFDLAADPRTCADSVAHCFSQLEVGMHVAQFTHNGEPLATANERLRLAQRLFRLKKVEDLAREDMDARYADGRWQQGQRDEEEVELSLVYRTRLGQRLNLLGQADGLWFGALAQVEETDIDNAYSRVLAAEATDERAVFISKLAFWQAALRAQNTAAFTAIEDSYLEQWEAMETQEQSQSGSEAALGDPHYLALAKRLLQERDDALVELALQLTREALPVPAEALPPSGQTSHPD